MKRLIRSVCLLFMGYALSAQPVTFTDVKARFVKSSERAMDEKGAELQFDPAARRLRVKSSDRPLDVGYDDILKVVAEVDTLGRKSGLGSSILNSVLEARIILDAIASSRDKPFDNDHFLHIEHKTAEGSAAYGLVVDRASVPRIFELLRAAVGDRFQVPMFTGKLERIEEGHVSTGIKGIRCINTDKQHPQPQLRSDKALVVVANPATIMRRIGPEKEYWTARLYAANRLVSVTGPGTYHFFYLDPGEHLLKSETGDVVGLRVNLEAGKDYYLTLSHFTKGTRLRSLLTRHSKELVMYEVAGSWWSDFGLIEGK